MRLEISSEKSFRSSAKSVGCASSEILSQRSFMNIKNSRGPSTEPCKMPLSTSFREENKCSSLTDCVLPLSHASIQL